MRKFQTFPGKLFFILIILTLVIAVISGTALLAQQPSPVLPATVPPQPSSFNPTPPAATSPRLSSTPASDIPPEITQFARDWPLPNRDYNSTRSTKDSTINSGNVNTLGVAWQLPIQGSTPDWGSAATSPIILGNNIYFQDLAYNIYSINLQNGAVNWLNENNNPYTGPNGVSAGWGKIFATTDLYNMAALDINSGQLIWNSRLATANPYLKVSAAPMPYGGLVYTSDTFDDALNIGGISGYFYALDQSNGAVKWSLSGVDEPETFWGHPEINSGGGAWMPASIDTASGMLYWGTKNPGNGSGPNGPYSGTLEYPNGASRPGLNLYSNCIMAFDAKCGKLIWYNQAFPHDLYNHDFQNPPILCTANLFGKNTEIAVGSGKGGIVYAYNRANGGTLWETPVGQHQYDNLQILPDNPDLTTYPGVLGGVTTPPAYADGMIFVPYCDLWGKYTSTGLSESQNINDGTGGICAIDVNTGSILWNNSLPELCLGAATVVNDLVFTATIDGRIYAFAVTTGQLVWSYTAPNGITACPAVAGNSIIWPCGYGSNPQLICLRLGATPTATPPPTTAMPPPTTTIPPTPTITSTPVSTNITINYFITQINNFNIINNIWPGTVIFKPSRPPHGVSCNTFVNITAKTTIINKSGNIPEGGCLVIQCFDQNRVIIGYYVMVKVKGFDPENNDWFWCQYNPDGTMAVQGKIGYCISCHSQRKNNDYVWTSPIVQGTNLQPVPTQFPAPLVTPSPTLTPLPGASPIPTTLPSPTISPSVTASPSPTTVPSPTPSPSPSLSPTITLAPSPSISPSPTVSPSPSPIPTPSITPTPSPTTIPSPSLTPSPSIMPTPTMTVIPTPSPSPSPSVAPSPTLTPSPSPSITVIPSPSISPSPSPSPSISPTVIATPTLPPAGNYTPITGWYNGGPAQYFDFGTNTLLLNNVPSKATMYEFAYGVDADGTPDLVPGQRPVIDVLPGESGYSDLWQISLVIVPQGYQSDSIRSATDITATGLNIIPTDLLVNRPVVGARSVVTAGKSLAQAWFQGQPVSYVDFGENPDTAVPVYIPVRGIDAQGNPLLVPGQGTILTVAPDDPDYSAFCVVNYVTVPGDYTPNSLKSAADVSASGYSVTTTRILVNYPVISVTRNPSPSPGVSSPASVIPSPIQSP